MHYDQVLVFTQTNLVIISILISCAPNHLPAYLNYCFKSDNSTIKKCNKEQKRVTRSKRECNKKQMTQSTNLTQLVVSLFLQKGGTRPSCDDVFFSPTPQFFFILRHSFIQLNLTKDNMVIFESPTDQGKILKRNIHYGLELTWTDFVLISNIYQIAHLSLAQTTLARPHQLSLLILRMYFWSPKRPPQSCLHMWIYKYTVYLKCGGGHAKTLFCS